MRARVYLFGDGRVYLWRWARLLFGLAWARLLVRARVYFLRWARARLLLLFGVGAPTCVWRRRVYLWRGRV